MNKIKFYKVIAFVAFILPILFNGTIFMMAQAGTPNNRQESQEQLSPGTKCNKDAVTVILGVVRNKNDEPLEDIKITFYNQDSTIIYTCLTDQFGTYSSDDYLPSGWSGSWQPSLDGYSFKPSFRDTTNLQGLLTGQNFTRNDLLTVHFDPNEISICSGQAVTLTPQVSGGNESGYTYSWTDLQGNHLSNDLNYTVTPEANMEYVFIVFDGYHTAEDTIIVYVLDIPEAFEIDPKDHLNASICKNQHGARYSVPIVPNTTYSWSVDPPSAGHIAIGGDKHSCMVNWNAEGISEATLMVELTNNLGCNAKSIFELTFDNFTAPETTIRQKGTSGLLFCDSIPNASYTWGFSPKSNILQDQIVESGHNNYFFFNNFNPALNFYWVEIQDDQSCITRFYFDYETGTNHFASKDFMVFPNPFNETLTIGLSGEPQGNTRIIISDLFGKQVFEHILPETYEGNYTINTRSFDPGFYIVSIYVNDTHIYSTKIIKTESIH